MITFALEGLEGCFCLLWLTARAFFCVGAVLSHGDVPAGAHGGVHYHSPMGFMAYNHVRFSIYIIKAASDALLATTQSPANVLYAIHTCMKHFAGV